MPIESQAFYEIQVKNNDQAFGSEEMIQICTYRRRKKTKFVERTPILEQDPIVLKAKNTVWDIRGTFYTYTS